MKKTRLISSRGVAGLALLAAFVPVHRLHAQTSWTGAGSDNLWSNASNWTSGAPNSATNVTLGETDKTSSSTPNSTVAANTTILQLLFKNTGTTSGDWQVVNIDSGVTLTATRELQVGLYSSTGVSDTVTTQAKLTGAGKFIMNSTGRDVTIRNSNTNNSATGYSYATLDASTLAEFELRARTIAVGSGQASVGTLLLGQTSTVFATTLTVGANGNSGPVSTDFNAVHMGNTTLLQVDTINIATSRSHAILDFQAGLSGTPSVVIRGTASMTARADMIVGSVLNQRQDNPMLATVDFTGGTVDALFNNLVVGTANRDSQFASGLGGGVTAAVSMNAGTIDATAIIVGRSTNTNASFPATASAGLASGALTVNGGALTAGAITLGQSAGQAAKGVINIGGTGSVETTGNIQMASQSSTTSTAAATAIVNLAAGTLKVGGDIVEGSGAGGPGSIASTVNLSGGMLDMTHGAISVDTFTFTGGTLKNVAAFGGDLNAQNSSTLAFDLDGSFTTLVLTGGLTLGASSNLSLFLANGFTPAASYTLVGNDLGDSITGTFLHINGGAFGVGNTFTMNNNTGVYIATLNYFGGDGNDLVLSLASVPEPSTCAIFAGLGMLGMAVWKRRR